MRNYELVIVLDGKATSAKKKSASEKYGKAKDLGVKDLAYQIGKSTTGAYLLFELELEPEKARELGNKLRLDNDLIRYLLVRGD